MRATCRHDDASRLVAAVCVCVSVRATCRHDDASRLVAAVCVCVSVSACHLPTRRRVSSCSGCVFVWVCVCIAVCVCVSQCVPLADTTTRLVL